MSEGDEIIILALTQAGIALPSDVASIKQFTDVVLFSVLSTALRLIKGEEVIQDSLPKGVAARHRVCTNLGTTLKGMGYQGETGYSAFLYPNEQDTKKLLSWLVGALPKRETERTEEVLGQDAILNMSINDSLRAWSKRNWFPSFSSSPEGSQPSLLVTSAVEFIRPDAGKETKEYYARYQPMLLAQPSVVASREASVIEENFSKVVKAMERENEWAAAGNENLGEYLKAKKERMLKHLGRAFGNAKSTLAYGSLSDVLGSFNTGDGSGSRKGMFERAADFGQESSFKVSSATTEQGRRASASAVTVVKVDRDAERRAREEAEAAAQRAREEALERLQEELDSLNAQIADLAKRKAGAVKNVSQIDTAKTAEADLTADLEREYTLKKQTLEMLPDAANNIKRLQGDVQTLVKKLVTLSAEWETHRKPLLEEQRRLKADIAFRKENARRKVEEMKRMKEEINSMITQIRDAESRYHLLASEYEMMPKGISRGVYTLRIADIIKQIRKQKQQIQLVINDIKDVQKTINTVSDKLKNSEATADERIYLAATTTKAKDPAYVQAYKHLTELRQHFEDLLTTVSNNGKMENDVRDTELRNEHMASRSTNQNMERILSDIRKVKEENAELSAQLKG